MHYYVISPRTNPTGPDSGEYSAVRGGSYFIGYTYRTLRTPRRPSGERQYAYEEKGFRCVLPVEEDVAEPYETYLPTVSEPWSSAEMFHVPAGTLPDGLRLQAAEVLLADDREPLARGILGRLLYRQV